jgi:hypothetical protein
MPLTDTTRGIRDNLAGAERDYYRAGKLLIQVRDHKEFKEGGLHSFHAYLKGPLSDVDTTWAYELMDVASYFAEEDAGTYSVTSLEQLCRIQADVFPAQQPSALLTGTHSFTDPDGEVHVLDFQKDHTVKTLKAFLAAHRGRSAPKTLQSSDGKLLDRALASEKANLDRLSYRIQERVVDGATLVGLFVESVDGTFSGILDDLNDEV